MAGRGRGAGRPGSLEEARKLVTLVSSLSEAGDTLSVPAVAERLGIEDAEAEKLIELVLSSAVGNDVGLPLVKEDGDLVLISENGVHGRRLRLTHNETLALLAALERLGVAEDDPLRGKVAASLTSEPVDEDLVRRLMAGEAGDDELSQTLTVCGRAAARRHLVEFSYTGPGAEAPEHRRVLPLDIRNDEDLWYLDAYDLDRAGQRTFRIDRMTAPEEGGPVTEPSPGDARQHTASSAARAVQITFYDESLLNALPWHDLQIIERTEDGYVRVETPYYGGMWLPRMLAACGASAACSDAEVSELTRSYARSALYR